VGSPADRPWPRKSIARFVSFARRGDRAGGSTEQSVGTARRGLFVRHRAGRAGSGDGRCQSLIPGIFSTTGLGGVRGDARLTRHFYCGAGPARRAVEKPSEEKLSRGKDSDRELWFSDSRCVLPIRKVEPLARALGAVRRMDQRPRKVSRWAARAISVVEPTAAG